MKRNYHNTTIGESLVCGKLLQFLCLRFNSLLSIASELVLVRFFLSILVYDAVNSDVCVSEINTVKR